MEVSDSETDVSKVAATKISVHNNKMKSTFSDLTFEMKDADLDDSQKAELNKIVTNNRSTFAVNMKELGATNTHDHHIDTGNANPVSQHFYHASPNIQVEMRQIDELLEHGLIEPSTSEWRSPVVMIRKRDQSYHFAVDCRKLNAVTRKMSFPLPRLEDI